RKKLWILARHSGGPGAVVREQVLQQSHLLAESVDESDAPARVDRRPIELVLRFRVRAAADLSHNGDAGLADDQLSEPVRNSIGWPGSDCFGKCGQPRRYFYRLVV